MTIHPIDNPQIINNLFYPRRASPNHANDGVISVDDGVELGYRCYTHHSSAPVLLYFHGNGEIASDYDSIAPDYHALGLSLLVVDYRGYGWSTGTPLASKLLPDAQKVLDSIDTILQANSIIPERPLFLMGRSLGSAPAIYLAMNNSDKLNGLIIESGYADAPSLFRRLGIALPAELSNDHTLPIGNDEKMTQVTIPTLIIHGEKDMLIPVTHGKTLYKKSASEHKTLITIPNAGHNNVAFVEMRRYFDAIETFVSTHAD